jgi:dipeptidyl aminopeptidase/acylaminoacyl peptidase
MAFLIFLLAPLTAALARPGAVGNPDRYPPARVETYQTDGRSVTVEVFPARGLPAGSGKDSGKAPEKAPAVLLLHGASGLGRGEMIYPYAKAMAQAGISAFVVHYFDGIEPRRARHPAAAGLFAEREQVIEDALKHVRALPYVDRSRVGLFGMSLGGFHALGLGVQDPRITAVVDVFGALPAVIDRAEVRRMPPVLILHGARDRVVPVERARQLAAGLARAGVDYDIKIYPDQGHVFRDAALADSVRRTTEFLSEHLSPTRVAAW